MYNEKYVKTKTKFYESKINIYFHDNWILKDSSHWICLSVILHDSVFNNAKNYYPLELSEECKCFVKEKEGKQQ